MRRRRVQTFASTTDAEDTTLWIVTRQELSSTRKYLTARLDSETRKELKARGTERTKE